MGFEVWESGVLLEKRVKWEEATLFGERWREVVWWREGEEKRREEGNKVAQEEKGPALVRGKLCKKKAALKKLVKGAVVFFFLKASKSRLEEVEAKVEVEHVRILLGLPAGLATPFGPGSKL